ncbi:MAG: biopolymer transporter ExbD [Pseudomonadota bacterium]
MKLKRPIRKHEQILSQINVTPLVDVALTLLIIFILTAPFLQQGMPVNLPKAESPALKRTQSDVIVTIQENERIYIDDESQPVPLPQLEEKLKTIYATKLRKDLFIKADEQLRYKTIVQVMSIAKKAGVDRIGMLTQPE